MSDENEVLLYLLNLRNHQEDITKEDYSKIYEIAKSEHSLLRANAAVVLCFGDYREKNEQVLLVLTDDEDSLVRTEAADSLCIGRTQTSLHRLLELAENDPHAIVRGYAVMSYYDVFDNIYFESNKAYDFEDIRYTEYDDDEIFNDLFALYEKETSSWTKISYYEIFCNLKREEYLQNIIQSLASDVPEVRQHVLAAFENLYNYENVPLIEKIVAFYLKTEKVRGVKLRMEKLLEELHEFIQELAQEE